MTDRMRRVLTALLATELVGGPVVHFDETTNHRLHRVEHLDLFRHGGPEGYRRADRAGRRRRQRGNRRHRMLGEEFRSIKEAAKQFRRT